MADSRKSPLANQDHPCFADCGLPIPKGEYYIQDTRTEGHHSFVRTVVTVRWHLEHAPRNKEGVKACLDAAQGLKLLEGKS